MSWPTSRKDKNEGYESQSNHYHSCSKIKKMCNLKRLWALDFFCQNKNEKKINFFWTKYFGLSGFWVKNLNFWFWGKFTITFVIISLYFFYLVCLTLPVISYILHYFTIFRAVWHCLLNMQFMLQELLFLCTTGYEVYRMEGLK